PNFLLVGTMKAGTTSLYHYVGQHPDVFVSPVKEPSFFAFEGDRVRFRGPRDAELTRFTSQTEYARLFQGARGESARGEASTVYPSHPRAPERIQYPLGTPRIVVMLRDPAERAFSHFLHLRRYGREPLEDFRAALRAEDERRRGGWDPFWFYRDR